MPRVRRTHPSRGTKVPLLRVVRTSGGVMPGSACEMPICWCPQGREYDTPSGPPGTDEDTRAWYITVDHIVPLSRAGLTQRRISGPHTAYATAPRQPSSSAGCRGRIGSNRTRERRCTSSPLKGLTGSTSDRGRNRGRGWPCAVTERCSHRARCGYDAKVGTHGNGTTKRPSGRTACGARGSTRGGSARSKRPQALENRRAALRLRL
jgi:hypothetical protein